MTLLNSSRSPLALLPGLVSFHILQKMKTAASPVSISGQSRISITQVYLFTSVYYGGMENFEALSKLARVWGQMLTRCYDQENAKWERYGGRGVAVCKEWHSCDEFTHWALANGYEPGLQIDRKDNDGDYCESNCHWITGKQNCRNKSNNRNFTIGGVTQCLAAWMENPRCTVTRRTIWKRLNSGWSPEHALFAPAAKSGRKGVGVSALAAFGETRSLIDWVADPRCAVDYDTLKERVRLHAWAVEDAIRQPKMARVALSLRGR